MRIIIPNDVPRGVLAADGRSVGGATFRGGRPCAERVPARGDTSERDRAGLHSAALRL